MIVKGFEMPVLKFIKSVTCTGKKVVFVLRVDVDAIDVLIA